MIPYSRQTIGEEELKAVAEVLESPYLTQGPKIHEFETALAEYCGTRYAVAVASGTAALHLANLAIGTGEGDLVVTSPITFVASSNAVIYASGTPVFADIQPDTFNIDPQKVRQAVKEHGNVKGIIPVHLAGLVPQLEELHAIAEENDLWVIEDASHAIGGRWSDSKGIERRVGDCAYSDMSAFSFHPVKHITTGEGGAITTNRQDLYQALMTLRTHGITKDPDRLIENHGGWYYEMHDLGFNYRITDIQAALGIEQLKKSAGWVDTRLELVTRYDQAFRDLSQVTPQVHPIGKRYAYHLYVIQAEDRRGLYDYLHAQDILAQVHYIPVHLQPYYQKRYGFGPGNYPLAEHYYEKALSLPLFPTLSFKEQDFVIESVKTFYG